MEKYIRQDTVIAYLHGLMDEGLKGMERIGEWTPTFEEYERQYHWACKILREVKRISTIEVEA